MMAMAASAKLPALSHSPTALLHPFRSVLDNRRAEQGIGISLKPNKKKRPHSTNANININCLHLSYEASTIPTIPEGKLWTTAHGYKPLHDPKSAVLNYLAGLGIDTAEVQELELPTALEVMKERVEFLQKLGMTIEDINEYPLMVACSVKKNMVPVLDYLQKLGVRKAALADMLRRYPQVLHASVVIDLQPVINYLCGLNIKANDIPRVIESYPELLGFKLEGTMSTSVAYLVSIGVNPRVIGSMLAQYPHILAMRVGRIIKPFVDYVHSLGVRKQVLAGVLEKKPYVLGFGLENQVKENVERLVTFGVRKEALSSVIAQYPEILGLDLGEKLGAQRDFLELKLGMGSVGFARIVEKMPQVVSLSRDAVVKRTELLGEWGFSRMDMGKMVVACPQLLALNLDVMQLSFDYFRHEMSGSLRELVEFPAFFTYSLETRIKPRFRKLSKKGIKCSLAWFLICTDQKFEQRLQAEYIGIEEMEPPLSRDEPAESAGEKSPEEEEEESEGDEDGENEEEPESEYMRILSL